MDPDTLDQLGYEVFKLGHLHSGLHSLQFFGLIGGHFRKNEGAIDLVERLLVLQADVQGLLQI